MKKETAFKLDSVFKYRFFESVGEPLPLAINGVTSWKAAFNEGRMRKWERCRLMARNALQGAIELRAWQRAQQWNPLVDELRPKIGNFIDREISYARVPVDYMHLIKNEMSWDLMGICFEEEYRDLVESIFFISHLEPWYASGHFPCGWTGRGFPDGWDGVVGAGQLIVY